MEIKGNLKSVLSTELDTYLADSGTTNAYAVTLRPAITAYTTGLSITFQAASANTASCTLAVNGLTATTIKKNVSTNLAANDILANQIVTVVYDGTNFQMISPTAATGTDVGMQKMIRIDNGDLDGVAGTIVSKAGTITGTAGVGSSLFLHRITVAAPLNATEIDVAMSIGFPATNQGAGTMSRSMAIYSFGNSTSLATVASVSGTSAWVTGTSTAGGNTSLTQYQGGWSSPLIQPMTFAATSIPAGEYVIGQLFDFAQASSTWTINFYGQNAITTFLASAATGLTSATLSAASTFPIAAGSGITGVAAGSVVTGTLAASGISGTIAASAYSATVVASGITGMSSYGAAFLV